MKKFAIVMSATAILLWLGWQNRIDIVVWAAPIALNALKPVTETQDITWQQGPTTAQKPANKRPPNIILIMTDDMGFNDISLYNGGAGDGQLQTPSIDALAQQGVRFNRGYAANAICAPSRASALTGRYSTRFGFEYTPIFKLGPTIFEWMQELEPAPLPMLIDKANADAMPAITELGMPASEITIAEVLQQRGYYTAHIGKWHVGSVGDMRPEKQGFDDSLNLAGTLYLPEDDENVVNAKIANDGIDRMVWATAQYAAEFNGSEKFSPRGYLTDYYTDEAVNVINANKNRPFFLYLAHWGTHNPLQAAKDDYEALSHIEDHGLRVYSAMIRAVDRSVNRIVASLEANGLTDNTLIIFTSDNGGAGYINLANINKPYRGWKLNHFEGGIHVPYIAKWPSRFKANTTFDSPIHHIDLFHTIAAAAEASIPTDRPLDGVNLLPYIAGKKTQAPHKTLFWRQGYQQTVLDQGWKLIRSGQPEKPSSSKLKKFLFHLDKDPTEQRNLALNHPDKVQELEALLDAHNSQQMQPLWPSIMHSPQRIDKIGNAPWHEDDEYIYWPN